MKNILSLVAAIIFAMSLSFCGGGEQAPEDAPAADGEEETVSQSTPEEEGDGEEAVNTANDRSEDPYAENY